MLIYDSKSSLYQQIKSKKIVNPKILSHNRSLLSYDINL